MEINRNKVKEIMINKGISLSELAIRMNVSSSRVSSLLNKEVSKSQIKTIHSLAIALDVQPLEILKGEI